MMLISNFLGAEYYRKRQKSAELMILRYLPDASKVRSEEVTRVAKNMVAVNMEFGRNESV
jgi:hypothetical protein